MKPVATIAAALLVSVLLSTPRAAQKDPPVGDVLRAVSDYLAAYAPRISGVTLDEDYTLLDVSGGRVLLTRRIASDLVLLNLDGTIQGLRDPYAVDANPLRPRTPRITALLAKPSAAAWESAQAHAVEFARYFEDTLVLRLNDPTLALRFLAPAAQARVAVKVDGRKKIGGVETVVLKFQETKTRPPAYLLDTPGKAVASGKAWVDPASGRIHRTELSMQSDSESAHIIVDYARDAALDLWLPSFMTDTYESTERVGPGMTNMGSGSSGISRRSLDCRATYANPRLTPIDLSGGK